MLARKLMLKLVGDFQEKKELVLKPKFMGGLRSILSDSSLDKVRSFYPLDCMHSDTGEKNQKIVKSLKTSLVFTGVFHKNNNSSR